MATLEDIVAGLIEFRDEVYLRLTSIETKVEADRVIYTNCAHCNANNMANPDPSSCTVCGGIGFRPCGKTGKKESD